MKKPSIYAGISPFSSVFQKREHEIIAQNIMLILKRTGDEFRELSFEEYEQERQKDGDYSPSEKKYFDDVIKFCKSAGTAKCFSKAWDI